MLNSKKAKSLVFGVVTSCFFGFANAAPIIIDDFNGNPWDIAGDNSNIVDVNGCEFGIISGTGCFSSEVDASVLGGERDIFVDLIQGGGVPSKEASIVIFDGVASYNTPQGYAALGSLTYDGVDGGDLNNVNTKGLNTAPGVGFDLTDGGTNVKFVNDVLASDADYLFRINLWDGNGDLWDDLNVGYTRQFISVGTMNDIDGDPIPQQRIIPFAIFGGFDFSNVGALQFVIDPLGEAQAVDLALARISVVPEPTTLAIFGLGLLGLGLSRRRKA